MASSGTFRRRIYLQGLPGPSLAVLWGHVEVPPPPTSNALEMPPVDRRSYARDRLCRLLCRQRPLPQ